jgi:hypothetical protein
MPAAFTTWTVLPHRPARKVSANLWTVDGKLGDIARRMAVARLADGRLLVHNAIALDDGEMVELDAWGEVAGIVVPNAYHRQDARIWKDRYPKAKVYCPKGATKGVAKVVPVDGSYDDAPADPTVRLRHLDGVAAAEGVLEVRADGELSAVLNDVVMNVPKAGFPMGFVLGPTGVPAVPRVFRWMVTKDKAALRADLERMAADPTLTRVIMSHGAPFEADAANTLRQALTTM